MRTITAPVFKLKGYTCLLVLSLLTACSQEETEDDPYRELSEGPSIKGRPDYLASPFVTAGDRVYMVGHQDGSFPDLGWHIAGEMGGIWDHPIKLMDGFAASVTVEGSDEVFCLNSAGEFLNFPIGNRHHFMWEKEGLSVTRFQFVPDKKEGLVVQFRITNESPENKEIIFSFTGMTDLRPTWLGERTDMIDSPDEIVYDEGLDALVARDQNNPWYTAFGSSFRSLGGSKEGKDCVPTDRQGSGENGTLLFSLTLRPLEEKVVPVFIAGSYTSEAALRENYESLRKSPQTDLVRKIERFRKIDAGSKLTIPDKNLERMYGWLKYNTDWLVRHVPEHGVAVSAGLPDYPWWFGADMAYALQGILATGDHELVRNSITLLHHLSDSANGNGRIVHEVSTNGAVYNAGNVNETAQFISLLHTYFQWTGDKELITRLFPDVKSGIKWLLEEMDPDGNGYPNGSGMMEIHGLDTEMIDVAVYTQQALSAAASLARALEEDQVARDYADLAESLRVKINEEWWNPQEASFGDFRGTVAGAKPVLEAAIIRADTLNKPWAVKELKATRNKLSQYPAGRHMPHVVYHNWVVNTPMETGVADPEKGKMALQTARKYENAFGVFVTGIDRTEEADSVVLKSRKQTFSYTGAVMTLPTGVQAVAAARYGTPEEALGYLKKLERSFSYALPGSMYEVSPDFGMITQAWNIYGVAVPIVHHFFGIQPDANEHIIHLSPRLPSSWNEASLDNVRVGNNSVSISISREEDCQVYRIHQTLPDWTVSMDVKGARRVMLNAREVDLEDTGDELHVTGTEIALRIYL